MYQKTPSRFAETFLIEINKQIEKEEKKLSILEKEEEELFKIKAKNDNEEDRIKHVKNYITWFLHYYDNISNPSYVNSFSSNEEHMQFLNDNLKQKYGEKILRNNPLLENLYSSIFKHAKDTSQKEYYQLSHKERTSAIFHFQLIADQDELQLKQEKDKNFAALAEVGKRRLELENLLQSLHERKKSKASSES